MNHSNARESFPEYTPLGTALTATKRRIKTVWICAALGVWLGGTAGFVLLFVVGDHWIPGGVPAPAGWAARTLYGVGSLLWLVLAVGLPLIRRIHDLYAARLIERSHPDFRNTLTDAVQLGGNPELPGSVRVAIVTRADDEVARVDFLSSVSARRLRQVGIVCGCLLAGLAIYGLFAPKPILPSVARAFGARMSAPTWTRIREIAPADGTSVLRGDAVRFSARLTGRTPASVRVRFSVDGGATWVEGQQLDLRPPPDGKTGAWRAVKAGQDVQQSMVWQVLAGDAVSAPRRLEVREIPVITSIQHRLEPPGYTGLPPSTQPGGDIDALVGTRASIIASANVPVCDVMLVTGTPPDERRRILPPPPSARPSEIAADLLVEKDDSYEVHFRDAWGQAGRNPIRYTIRARPDSPPVIRVREPGPVVEVADAGPLPVAGRVEDDFGITRAAVALRVKGRGLTRELPLSVVSEPGGRSGELNGQVDPRAVEAMPGDIVEWWICAWDNREDPQGRADPQKTESEIRRIVLALPPTVASGETKTPPPSTSAREASPGAESSAATAPADQPTAVADATQTALRPASEQPASAKPDREETQAPDGLEDPRPADAADVRESLAAAEGAAHVAHEEPPATGGDEQAAEAEPASDLAASDEPAPEEPAAQPPPDTGVADADAADAPTTNQASTRLAEGELADAERERQTLEEFVKQHQRELEILAKRLEEDSAQARPACPETRPGDRGSRDPSSPAASTGEGKPGEGRYAAGDPGAEAGGADPQDGNGADGRQSGADRAGSGQEAGPAGASSSGHNGRSSEPAGRAPRGEADSAEGREKVHARGHSGGEDAGAPRGQSVGPGGDPRQAADEQSANQREGQEQGKDRRPGAGPGQDGTDAQEKGRRQASGAEQGPPPGQGQASAQGQKPGEEQAQEQAGKQGQAGGQGQAEEQGQEQGQAPSSGERPGQREGRDAGATRDPNGDPHQTADEQRANEREGREQGKDRRPGERSGQDGEQDLGKGGRQASGADQRQPPGQGQASAQGQKPRGEQGQKQAGEQGQAEEQDQERGRAPNSSEHPGQREKRDVNITLDPGGEPHPTGDEEPANEREGREQGKDLRLGAGPGQIGTGGQEKGRRQAPGSEQGQSQGQGQAPGRGQESGAEQAQPGEQGQEQNQAPNSGANPGQREGRSAGPAGDQGHAGSNDGQGGAGRDAGWGRPAPAEPLTLPEKAAEPDRPLQLPSPPANPGAPLPSSGRLDRLMDLFERELRGGAVDPSLLVELKWTLPQARQFVEAYKRTKAGGQRQVEQTVLPQQVRTDDAPRAGNQVLRGGTAIDPSARTLRATHGRAPDRTRELMEVGRQRITPRYRSVMEAYYRSVTSRPAP